MYISQLINEKLRKEVEIFGTKKVKVIVMEWPKKWIDNNMCGC